MIRPLLSKRAFSLLPSSTTRSHKNRIFDPIRTPSDLHSLTLLNAADNRALITLWSARWCQTCQVVSPLVRSLVEEEKVGEDEGGLGFVEVEMDSTLIGDLPVVYRVSFFPQGRFGRWEDREMWDLLWMGDFCWYCFILLLISLQPQISSMPTLLAFSRQEAQFDTKLSRPEDMRNKEFLRRWLIEEARRGGRSGGGGGKGLFGW